MDTKKVATAVLNKSKQSETSQRPQEQTNPKEEARMHLTEELIHSSEKRLHDALDKFKASESVQEEAHMLSNDIAGRIRRLSQTAKTEDAFRRDVDEFVSSAITYIINKARTENKKEKEKKEKEASQKKEKEKQKKENIDEDDENNEKEGEKEEKTQRDINTPIVTSEPVRPQEAFPQSLSPQTDIMTTRPSDDNDSEQKTAQQASLTSASPETNKPEQMAPSTTPKIEWQHPPITEKKNTNNTTDISQGNIIPHAPIPPGTMPSKTNAKNTVVPGSFSHIPPNTSQNNKQSINKASTPIPSSSVSASKNINPPLIQFKKNSSNAVPKNTQHTTGKNKAEAHYALRHAIQNSTITKKSLSNQTTTPQQKTGHILKGNVNAPIPLATAKGKKINPIKKAIPLALFHKFLLPSRGDEEEIVYTQEVEGNDRGAAVTGNMRTDDYTPPPITPQRNTPQNEGADDGGNNNNIGPRKSKYPGKNTDRGSRKGPSQQKKKKNKGGALSSSVKNKLGKQVIKTGLQAVMRSPIFWGIVLVILIIIILLFIILGIGSEKTEENTNNPTLTLTKTGPTKATRGQNLDYTITANYPAAAEDLTIIDRIPQGVTYVSSNPTGTYDAAARTVTWNARTLNIPLSNPVSMVVNVTLRAETDNITAINIATGEVIPSEGSLLNVTKTGPPTATVGQNAEYTINATYQGAAEDITIIDKIPTGVKYISSAPAGTYDAAGRTVTWNAKQLKLQLANPLNLSVKVTLLVEANDVALVNQATATVKASASGAMNIPPNNDDCHGVYKSWMDQLKRVGKSNYGDPACELVKQDPNGRWIIDKDKMLAGFKTIMPANEAEGAFFCIVPTESNYNSNAWNPKSTSTARGSSGAYGNFQMNEAKYSNTGQPEDVGDVAWRQQAFNAYTWKNKYRSGAWRGYWPQMYIGCLNKYGL